MLFNLVLKKWNHQIIDSAIFAIRNILEYREFYLVVQIYTKNTPTKILGFS